LKQARSQQSTAAPSPKKPRIARSKKPTAAPRKYTAPIFKTGLAGSVLKFEQPFAPVWQISEQEREKIRKELVSGFKEVNDLYLEESKAWYPLEEEVYAKSLREA
jgi:hypothetical protein